jgi:hypothetical protein
MYSTAALANCAVVSLGSSMSLMTCSGGIRGTLTNLGKSLSVYRLSTGASGMLNLGASSTTSTTTNSLSSSTSSTQPPSGAIYYLVNETVNVVADAAAAMNGKLGGVTAIQPVLDAPLTPVMTNVATTGIAVPAPPPRR